jgi:Family of unknown function (DUF5675)
MLALTLERLAYLPFGTFGRVILPDGATVYTVEPAWRDNAKGESCIPEGTYRCGRSRFNAGGYASHEVQGVPGRTQIKFHRGNFPSDSEGCILIVSRLAVSNAAWPIKGEDSRAAWDVWRRQTEAGPFELTIRAYRPGQGPVP